MRNRRTLTIHLLALAAFSAALYLPMMGRGFILDDFGHLFVAGQESVRFGLTRASGGPYYTPIAYVSFKTDSILGARALSRGPLRISFFTLQIRCCFTSWRCDFGAHPWPRGGRLSVLLCYSRPTSWPSCGLLLARTLSRHSSTWRQ